MSLITPYMCLHAANNGGGSGAIRAGEKAFAERLNTLVVGSTDARRQGGKNWAVREICTLLEYDSRTRTKLRKLKIHKSVHHSHNLPEEILTKGINRKNGYPGEDYVGGIRK